MQYNKLVRDRIPDIIRKKGHKAVIGFVGGEDFLDRLVEKIGEEARELAEARKANLTHRELAEELADILEAAYALGEKIGYDHYQLEDIRQAKQRERGGFNVGIILVSVHDNTEGED